MVGEKEEEGEQREGRVNVGANTRRRMGVGRMGGEPHCSDS